MKNLPFRITSYVLVLLGAGLLGLNIFMGGAIHIALPLVFLVLGGAFLIVIFKLRQKWDWASFLYIPAAMLTAFGIIFLINVLTADWASWSYAWLFLLTALGIGILLTNREHMWSPLLFPVGWGFTLGGITLFAIFGAIVGGLFIQVMAPVLLVVAGFSLRWLRIETILPLSLSDKLHLTSPRAQAESAFAGVSEELAEPLSVREIEVLRLIDSGFSNQQIASKLSVATSTVKTHINNIYGKLGVQTRVQAVNRARELNLIKS